MTGIVLGIRWGIESALFLLIMYAFLTKIDKKEYIFHSFLGIVAGVIAVILLLVGVGEILALMDPKYGLYVEAAALIMLLIVVMAMIHLDKHQDNKSNNKIAKLLEKKQSATFVFMFSFVFVFHHIFELLGFYLAGQLFINQLLLGLLICSIGAFLSLKGIFKVSLHLLINLTTIYLILQIGAMFGGLANELVSNSPMLYSISDPTHVLSFIETLFGVPMEATRIQFIVQYGITILMFAYFYIHETIENKKHRHSNECHH